MRALVNTLLAGLLGCSARYQPLECPKEGAGEGYQLERTDGRYDVEGKTYSAYSQARKKAAFFGLFITPDRPAVALTDSRMCLRYRLTWDDTQCSLGSARLLHRVRVTTPRWIVPAGASAKDLELLRADDALLATHEEGHARIAEAAARHVFAVLQKIAPAPTCAEVEGKAKALVAEVTKEVEARQKAYDATTDHGRKQSAADIDALPAAWLGWE
ncbi:MAG: DUF922 domain-containing protein [Myxococcales bacterium]|nr:DUF922 domain-containing protein [Myxococcales bacterium]